MAQGEVRQDEQKVAARLEFSVMAQRRGEARRAGSCGSTCILSGFVLAEAQLLTRGSDMGAAARSA